MVLATVRVAVRLRSLRSYRIVPFDGIHWYLALNCVLVPPKKSRYGHPWLAGRPGAGDDGSKYLVRTTSTYPMRETNTSTHEQTYIIHFILIS